MKRRLVGEACCAAEKNRLTYSGINDYNHIVVRLHVLYLASLGGVPRYEATELKMPS